jgi:hypothetical protein
MIKLKNILLEVSLDQLKTQFVDTGKISDSEFAEIVDATGGRSAYATWLTKMVVMKLIKPEDLYKYNAYFKIFDRRKREYPFNDINQYKTSQDISQFITKSVEIANTEKADPSQQKGVSKTDKYNELRIGSVDGFDVYRLPRGRRDLYGASCELGSGTGWCTATGKTKEYFNHYIKYGPLFIFIKPGSDEKYQFLYEVSHFTDKDDVTIENNLTPRILNLFEFIESKYPKYTVPLRLRYLIAPDTITNGMTANGDVDLSYTDIESLPDNLTIKRDLNLMHTPIKSLPNNLTVGGKLYLGYTPITSLPNNLNVGGDITLSGTGNPNLASLGDNITVKGGINLSSTKINSIPNNFNVGDSLWLVDTPLSRKYDRDQIRKMIEDKGGSVGDRIRTSWDQR